VWGVGEDGRCVLGWVVMVLNPIILSGITHDEYYNDMHQVLISPSDDHGRFSVADDGTLIIEPVQREDAGVYRCKAISVSGSAYAQSRLEVKGQWDLYSRLPATCRIFLSLVLYDMLLCSFRLRYCENWVWMGIMKRYDNATCILCKDR